MGNQASSGVYTGAPPPRKAKPLYKDMEEAWKLIGAYMSFTLRLALGLVRVGALLVRSMFDTYTTCVYTRPIPTPTLLQPPACRTATG